MKQSACVIALVLLSIALGCQKTQKSDSVRRSLKLIDMPKGSVVQYAEAPRGTQFLPGKGLSAAKPTSLPTEGYVLFIDEQPKYDWAHGFQLVFVPKASGKPNVLFRGSAIPDFTFKKPDGSTVTEWKKH
jgi:hypothetical protein